MGYGGHAMTKVSLLKGADRKSGVRRAVDLLGINPVRGKDVLLKPNFNTSDPFPASTHNDTLEALMLHLKEMGAGAITVGERSGPPDTANVIRDKGIRQLCGRMGVGLVNFEDLGPGDWVRVNPEGSHWRKGFDVAKPIVDAGCVVTTCCLKTHAYGGVFTMSLKLSVGITNKRNMTELHSSFLSMRKMIAEINQAYRPGLIVMDAMDAFTDGGPATGELKSPGVIAAGTDRVAIDAVGLAILKDLGANRDIMGRNIFAQEQIARAVELGLGVSGPDEIELVTDDAGSSEYAARIAAVLAYEGGRGA
jgi:uncharacterized protein (DUF362 family)